MVLPISTPVEQFYEFSVLATQVVRRLPRIQDTPFLRFRGLQPGIVNIRPTRFRTLPKLPDLAPLTKK